MASQCQAIKKDGTRCNAICAAGKKYCSFHDPVIQKNNPTKNKGRKKDPAKYGIVDIIKLLQNTVKKVMKDKIDSKKAHEIGYLASIMIRALESTTNSNELYEENLRKTAKEMDVTVEELRQKVEK